MTVKTTAVTVTTTATRLDTVADDGSGVSGQGSSWTGYNNSAVTIYIGGSDVTTSNGAPVAAGTWGPGIDLDVSEGVYGVVAAATAAWISLEEGV